MNACGLPDRSRGTSSSRSRFDIVINTHLHWDHCGGNTIDEGDAGIPGALYYTQRGELEHAREQHPRDAVSYRAINYEPLLDAGQMQLLDGDSELRRALKCGSRRATTAT